MVDSIKQIKARRGQVIVITDENNRELDEVCESVIYVPTSPDHLNPLLTLAPLQMLAYYMGVMRGKDVDNPEALVKVATAEVDAKYARSRAATQEAVAGFGCSIDHPVKDTTTPKKLSLAAAAGSQ